jgi:hypothetical protein
MGRVRIPQGKTDTIGANDVVTSETPVATFNDARSLTQAERTRLTANGEDPDQYVVLELPAVNMEAGMVVTPHGPVLVLTTMTVIPAALLNVAPARVLMADGRQSTPVIAESIKPYQPPVLRVIAHANLLSAETRARLSAAVPASVQGEA